MGVALSATNCDLLQIDSAASEASIVACCLAWRFLLKTKHPKANKWYLRLVRYAVGDSNMVSSFYS